eukprot:5447416-Amphidinium_carterae.3
MSVGIIEKDAESSYGVYGDFACNVERLTQAPQEREQLHASYGNWHRRYAVSLQAKSLVVHTQLPGLRSGSNSVEYAVDSFTCTSPWNVLMMIQQSFLVSGFELISSKCPRVPPHVKPKPDRVHALLTELDLVLSERRLTPSQACELAGKLDFINFLGRVP